ncbi:MAG TPA: helix-turn-helix transcriptional regulator [Polyangiaceae bacterium]|nr:helix-turn-helix transcriptional regulator [Polyangiaceae bacterium]
MAANKPLVRWRKKAGISQATAAERVFVTQPTWAGYEAGRYRPEFEIAARIELLSEGAVRVEAFGYDATQAFAVARAPWRAGSAA